MIPSGTAISANVLEYPKSGRRPDVVKCVPVRPVLIVLPGPDPDERAKPSAA